MKARSNTRDCDDDLERSCRPRTADRITGVGRCAPVVSLDGGDNDWIANLVNLCASIKPLPPYRSGWGIWLICARSIEEHVWYETH